MKKLALDLDDLAVESFATLEREGTRGTVRAHCSEWGTCDSCAGSCPLQQTCGAVERGSCGPQTCNGNVCVFESGSCH